MVVGAYENDPFAFRVKVPCEGPATRAADSEFPSASVSLPSTPGAATTSVVSSFVEYESLTAAGALLKLTVVVTD